MRVFYKSAFINIFWFGDRSLRINKKSNSKNIKRVLIITHCRKGFTDNIAEAIARGVKEVSNVKVVIKRVNMVQPSDLFEADAVAIGSPTHLNYISGELKRLLDDVYYKFYFVEKSKLRGKPAVAFICGKTKGYLIKKLQFKSQILKELERILFSKLEMKKAVDGIHLIHDIDILDPHAPLTLTLEQNAMCRNIGRMLTLAS